jgi:hypothetical protein
MKVAVWGADTFVGSNICNYMLQYTKNDIFGVFTGPPPYRHMEGPRRSRSRFEWQLTTAEHSAVEIRLQVECPDIVIVTTPVPEILHGKYNSYYVGQDHQQIGTRGMFLTPEPFGPRQPRGEGIANLMLNDEPPDEAKRTVIYIKDLYDQLMPFLESGAKWGSATGITTTSREIWEAPRADETTGFGLQAAILHTAAWYSSNTWFT